MLELAVTAACCIQMTVELRLLSRGMWCCACWLNTANISKGPTALIIFLSWRRIQYFPQFITHPINCMVLYPRVIWYGMVWCGVVWCGVVWCGVWCGVWYGVVWYGVVWCGVVWCVVWYGVVWYGMVWHNLDTLWRLTACMLGSIALWTSDLKLILPVMRAANHMTGYFSAVATAEVICIC